MRPHLPRFGLNEFTTKPLTFEEDLSLCQKMRVQWMEVAQNKLADDDKHARRQLESIADAGVKVCSVQPAVHAPFPERMAEQPTDPDERMKRFHEAIELVASSGLRDIPLVTISGRATDYDFRGAWERAVWLYKQAADHAAECSLKIAFEPLHPVLMNVDTFVCTLDDAMRLIDAVDRPNFGLTFDMWHLWPECDLLGRMREAMARTFIVHLSDWPIDGVRHVDDRVIPGAGRIDLGKLLDACETYGYRGVYCLEILSNEKLPDSLWRDDPKRVLEHSVRNLESIWPVRTEVGG